MTIPRMEAISARWNKVPPLSVSVAMVAAALGVKFERPGGSQEPGEDGDLQGLADIFGAPQPTPQWLKDAMNG